MSIISILKALLKGDKVQPHDVKQSDMRRQDLISRDAESHEDHGCCDGPGDAQADISNQNQSFEGELTALISRFSKENGSDTPDYILAGYLNDCLTAFNTTVIQRDIHDGRKPVPPFTGGVWPIEGEKLK